MSRDLVVTIDDEVYDGLHRMVGEGSISRFIEDLIRPRLAQPDLGAEYRAMAEDEAGQAEALEWAEATVGDVADEPG